MRTGSKILLAFTLLTSSLAVVYAQDGQVSWTDWGGGYLRGPDSASTTAATSGAGAPTAATIVATPAPVNVPLTDWGGGYLRGPDSASTTPATSGAGNPKPSN